MEEDPLWQGYSYRRSLISNLPLTKITVSYIKHNYFRLLEIDSFEFVDVKSLQDLYEQARTRTTMAKYRSFSIIGPSLRNRLSPSDRASFYPPVFLRPYHFLKLVCFLGAYRTKSASVSPWLLKGRYINTRVQYSVGLHGHLCGSLRNFTRRYRIHHMSYYMPSYIPYYMSCVMLYHR